MLQNSSNVILDLLGLVPLTFLLKILGDAYYRALKETNKIQKTTFCIVFFCFVFRASENGSYVNSDQ